MLKIIVISSLVLLGLFIIFILGAKYSLQRNSKKTKDDIITFMKKNPEDWSLSVIQNGEVVMQHNEDTVFPLASTVKILHAVAFIEAVSEQRLDPEEVVAIKDLDLLYIPNTDGNAHTEWKEREHIGDEVTLKQIAQGMMKYSSNACTDYLYYRLGKKAIEQVAIKYELTQQTAIFPIGVAVLIPSYLHIEEQVTKKALAKTMQQLTSEEYAQIADNLLHKILRNEAESLKEHVSLIAPRKIQKEITKRLPAATSQNYATFMYELGAGDSLSNEEQERFDEIMGPLYEHDAIRLWTKGGSTMYVLTYAAFQQNEKEQLSYAFFIEDTVSVDLMWITNCIADFHKSFLQDNTFRNKVCHTITIPK